MRYHCFIPFDKYKEIPKKKSEKKNPQAPNVKKSINFLVRKKGVIIPTESQATAEFEKNSERVLFCPTERFEDFIYPHITKLGRD